MNEQSLFDKCWQALKGGESLEAVLERYPDQRQELEPLLAAAGQLQAVSTVAAPPEFRQQARSRLLAQIDVAPQVTVLPFSQRLAAWWNDLWASTARPFAKPVWAGAAMSLLLVAFLFTSTTYAAQGAIPGDSLYSFKLISEQIWLRLVPDSSDFDLTLAERRLEEAHVLQTRNRHDAIPEALARYQQTLENWSEQANMAGLQDQDRVQLRLQVQLQTLQQMGEDAPSHQQEMMQEQLQTTERLLHRFGQPLLVPTPQRQPVRTPDPARIQQTPPGDGAGQIGPGPKNPTPGGQQATPTPKASPVPPTRTHTHTPQANRTGEAPQTITPSGPGTPEKPAATHTPHNTHTPAPTAQPQQTPQQPTATPQQGTNSPTRTPQNTHTPEPTAQPQQTPQQPTATPQQTPQQPTATPQHGAGSPTNTPAPPVADTPTLEPTPTSESGASPEPSPTPEPEPTSTPGGGGGGGSQPTATPGHGGPGGSPQPTTTPGKSG